MSILVVAMISYFIHRGLKDSTLSVNFFGAVLAGAVEKWRYLTLYSKELQNLTNDIEHVCGTINWIRSLSWM